MPAESDKSYTKKFVEAGLKAAGWLVAIGVGFLGLNFVIKKTAGHVVVP